MTWVPFRRRLRLRKEWRMFRLNVQVFDEQILRRMNFS